MRARDDSPMVPLASRGPAGRAPVHSSPAAMRARERARRAYERRTQLRQLALEAQYQLRPELRPGAVTIRREGE